MRTDLHESINLWTYELPGLINRSEDIEPNLDYLLAQFGAEQGQMVRFNKEARERYMRFAMSPDALWIGNFRDLSASVIRMATLADGGRVTNSIVMDETTRLKRLWHHHLQPQLDNDEDGLEELLGQEKVDLFDAVQLQAVIRVCRQSKSLSDAGRKLFAVSRDTKAKPNDADRLKKYLAKFGLAWETVSTAGKLVSMW